MIHSVNTTATATRRLRRRLNTTATTNNDDHIIMATRNWFERIVVGDTLCPFAPRRPELVRMVVTSNNDVVETVTQEVKFLFHTNKPIHETTLVILKNHELEFLEWIRLSWECQEHAIDGTDLVDQVQLVLFHPRATHQTYQDKDDGDDPRDYTIRSPYPTFHLLREHDVMRAVTSGYSQLETLPQRNKQKMVTQGLDQCRAKLRDCYLTSK